MPATYTHYVFGQDVFTLLSGKTQKSLLPYMGIYNIGVHGPDVLFYYHAFRENVVNQSGVKMHNRSGKKFFEHAFQVFNKEKNKDLARAYLAGFMTHFILDSTCHPYIRRRIEETGISHTEIETDLDSIFMEKNGLPALKYKPASHMRAKMKYARLMSPYLRKSPRQVEESIVGMKAILNHIFISHFGLKRKAFKVIGDRYYPSMDLIDYFAKPEINPRNKETCSRLIRMYESCQEECAAMIEDMLEALDSGQKDFLKNKRLRRIFA